jgi:hypothetical protein
LAIFNTEAYNEGNEILNYFFSSPFRLAAFTSLLFFQYMNIFEPIAYYWVIEIMTRFDESQAHIYSVNLFLLKIISSPKALSD